MLTCLCDKPLRQKRKYIKSKFGASKISALKPVYIHTFWEHFVANAFLHSLNQFKNSHLKIYFDLFQEKIFPFRRANFKISDTKTGVLEKLLK
jgi:hypothetical protein